MSKEQLHITVFEFESLRIDKGDKRITEEQFKALQKYFGSGTPFFSLRFNGVQFNEHVGVIQVGKTLIEVLPKADKKAYSEDEETKWRSILIGMLKAVGNFDIHTTSQSNLKIKPNTILDLYFEMFIKEVEYLLHNGLIKKYRKKEGDVTALKGSLQFAKQLQHNLTHQERFYVRHTTYDVEHSLHFIIYKALLLLKQINRNSALQGRIGSLLLHFPEMPNIKVSENTFDKIVYHRKNQGYKKTIEIARLLLLKYHPDLSKGRNHVLALMFDMNMLWEQFVYVSLKKQLKSINSISPQSSKFFWKPENGYRSSIRPDIVINMGSPDNYVVLDTKWKNLNGYNPSPDDLRQMYVYHEYYDAKRVALVYPGQAEYSISGNYLNPSDGKENGKECSVILIPVIDPVKNWQKAIGARIEQWIMPIPQ